MFRPILVKALNETLFHGLAHARVANTDWVGDCNTERAHSALGHQVPADYAHRRNAAIDRDAAPPTSFAPRSIAPPAPYQPKGLRFRPDESSAAGQHHQGTVRVPDLDFRIARSATIVGDRVHQVLDRVHARSRDIIRQQELETERRQEQGLGRELDLGDELGL
jgi:hypothetical protein